MIVGRTPLFFWSPVNFQRQTVQQPGSREFHVGGYQNTYFLFVSCNQFYDLTALPVANGELGEVSWMLDGS